MISGNKDIDRLIKSFCEFPKNSKNQEEKSVMITSDAELINRSPKYAYILLKKNDTQQFLDDAISSLNEDSLTELYVSCPNRDLKLKKLPRNIHVLDVHRFKGNVCLDNLDKLEELYSEEAEIPAVPGECVNLRIAVVGETHIPTSLPKLEIMSTSLDDVIHLPVSVRTLFVRDDGAYIQASDTLEYAEFGDRDTCLVGKFPALRTFVGEYLNPEDISDCGMAEAFPNLENMISPLNFDLFTLHKLPNLRRLVFDIDDVLFEKVRLPTSLTYLYVSSENRSREASCTAEEANDRDTRYPPFGCVYPSLWASDMDDYIGSGTFESMGDYRDEGKCICKHICDCKDTARAEFAEYDTDLGDYDCTCDSDHSFEECDNYCDCKHYDVEDCYESLRGVHTKKPPSINLRRNHPAPPLTLIEK